MRHLRSSVAALVVALLVLAGAATPALHAVAPTRAAGATGPKVVIVVGSTHSVTPTYRSYADAAYAEAIKYTPNVVKVYSPNATWAAVKAAAKGASILIYFGHGNGWPSPYTYDPKYTTKDGFGLNATAGNGDYDNKYYGEPYVSTLELADNAIVLLHHLCYASGNSEPGGAAPSSSTAKQRIDNYGAGFLAGNARAVLADGHHGPADYLKAIFTTNQTIESLWRNAPDANGHVSSFASTRTAGATAFMDPDTTTSGYYRSLVGDRDLTTKDITGAFAVPGRAAPKAAGAPLYSAIPTLTDTAASIEPAAVLPADTRLKLLQKVAGTGATAVFKVQGLDDASIAGYAIARDLEPRDSIAPSLSKLSGGGGKAYRTSTTDGHHVLSGTFSETADWIATIKRGDATVANTSGSGTSFTVDLAPDVALDGAYTYQVSSTDTWLNGPTAVNGTFTIDNVAPDLSTVSPTADAMPWVSPDGDGSGDSVTWHATASEPGSIELRVLDTAGSTLSSRRVVAGSGDTAVAWDGRSASGSPVPDGTYEVRLTPRDAAGNDGPPVTRSVLVDTTLGDVGASKVLFYPQDGDRLATTTTLRFALSRPATVTWAIVDAAGNPVVSLLDGVATPAGTVTRVFDGTRTDGTMLPLGTYRSVVTVQGDGPVVISRSRTFVMRAFDVTASDTTPHRGQTITVYETAAEPLSTHPRLYVVQPGYATWSAAMTKVSTARYRITITLKSGGRTGKVGLRVGASDVDGRYQTSTLYLPLH